MSNPSQHKINDNGKCEKCGLSEEYIEDKKVVQCKENIKDTSKNEKSVKPKNYF